MSILVFYVINQKHTCMIPRTDFHCKSTNVCMFLWVKFGNAFVYFVIPCLPARCQATSFNKKYQNSLHFDCKNKLCLRGP